MAPIKKYLLQKQTEKRQKDIITIKNLQIEWANAHNIAPGKIHQFLSYPSAIANSDLTPHKGVKSNAIFVYEKWFEKSFLAVAQIYHVLLLMPCLFYILLQPRVT